MTGVVWEEEGRFVLLTEKGIFTLTETEEDGGEEENSEEEED